MADELFAWEVWIRAMAGVSCLAAAMLLCHCALLPRKQLLAKQVAHLAFVDMLAFGVQAAIPWSPNDFNCYIRYSLFKFFLCLSIATELSIAIGTLAVSLRCSCLVRWGGSFLVALWPACILGFFFYARQSVVYDPDSQLCDETRSQVLLELVFGWLSFIVCCVAYGVVVLQACCRSPRSVTLAHARCSQGFLLTFVLTYTVYGIGLVNNLDDDHLGVLAKRWCYTGLLSMNMHGWLSAGVYMRQRLGSSNLMVAYQSEPEVLLLPELSHLESRARDEKEDRLARATASGGPFSSTTSQSSSEAQRCEYEVTLYSCGWALGVQLSSDMLEIEAIGGGLVRIHNAAHPRNAMRVGDRVVACNGVRLRSIAVLDSALASSAKVTLRLSRSRDAHKSLAEASTWDVEARRTARL